ncbi:hypothetical protein ACYEXS_11760 [Paenibacillus sp. MAH-36]|uniref:Uncharacterized protein n=1 Tax=Paenibacillus violae TaxID=3077234 RepID=A0ABU3R734_9BACL|nr:hypothetical protein [Paenibacillus sp. PFR10]MDU0200087.1 hypothetical protein [Paenibacillus sp. PFR10]
MKLGLVPLRIPSGWMVAYNNFLEISPYDFVDDTYKYAMELDEDILQMSNQYRKRILDLGWYPSFNPHGQYRIVLVELVDNESQSDKWTTPIVIFSSRDILTIKMTIDSLLEEVAEGRL